MAAVLVYITCKNPEEAESIARLLLEKNLIACANIIPRSLSLYNWKGKLEKANETILIAKTRKELVPNVVSETRKMHSYELPCILSIPIEGGNPRFIEWIESETSKQCR